MTLFRVVILIFDIFDIIFDVHVEWRDFCSASPAESWDLLSNSGTSLAGPPDCCDQYCLTLSSYKSARTMTSNKFSSSNILLMIRPHVINLQINRFPSTSILLMTQTHQKCLHLYRFSPKMPTPFPFSQACSCDHPSTSQRLLSRIYSERSWPKQKARGNQERSIKRSIHHTILVGLSKWSLFQDRSSRAPGKDSTGDFVTSEFYNKRLYKIKSISTKLFVPFILPLSFIPQFLNLVKRTRPTS